MKLEQYPDAKKDFLKAISISTANDEESKGKLLTTSLGSLAQVMAELMM